MYECMYALCIILNNDILNNVLYPLPQTYCLEIVIKPIYGHIIGDCFQFGLPKHITFLTGYPLVI